MENRPSAPPPRTDAQRQTRYNHLVERLRNRQITMEEATELFGLMQGMLRASEAARLALSVPAPTETKPHPAKPGPAVAGAVPASDDLMVMGILAMGAGAGLLAAITKRMAESAPPPASAPSRPGARPASR